MCYSLYFQDDIRGSHDSLPVRTVMVLTDELRPVVLYNSLAQNRLALVYLHVDTPYVELRDPEGKIVPTQVLPLWTSKESMSDQTFRVNKLWFYDTIYDAANVIDLVGYELFWTV